MFNKIKKLFTKFRDISILSLATIVTNGIGGIFWLYLGTILSTEKYGEISYLISIGILASTVSLVGMTNTIIVYGAKGVKIQSTAYVTGIISSVVTSLILFFVVMRNIEISIYVIGFVGFTLIGSNLLGQKLYSKYSKTIISQKILLVALAISFYYIYGLHGIILGIAISFLPFFWIFMKTFNEMKIDFSLFRNRLRFISNSYLLDLTGAFHGSLDKIIIAPILGYALLGNYQLGNQFISLEVIIPGVFYTYMLARDARGETTGPIKKIMILISVIIAVLSILLSPIVVPILFPAFSDAISVIQIMSGTVISSAIIYSYVSKFLGQTKSIPVIVGSVIYLAVQIPLIIILGEDYGVNGAALAILVASIIHALFLMIVDKKKLLDLKSEKI